MKKLFIDTNILVYSADNSEKSRQKIAQKIIKQLVMESTGVISTQVLQEFYVACTRKLRMDPLLVKGLIHTFNNFEVVTVTSQLLESAIDTSILNRLSFWGALIISAASNAGCSALLTEDLNHGQMILGVKIVNPFT